MSDLHLSIDHHCSAVLSTSPSAVMLIAIIDGLGEKTPAVIVFISNRADLLFTLFVQFE